MPIRHCDDGYMDKRSGFPSIRAGGVVAARPASQQAGGRAGPTSVPQSLRVAPVHAQWAKRLIVRHHYLHSMPGGTKLTLGVFSESRLSGAIVLGSGPVNAHRLVQNANPDDCLTLTRLWLSDDLPRLSESRVIGLTLRALRRETSVKFLISYADPAQGHVGTIYQATNWLYTGLSAAMPLYDLGDGVPRHTRSLGHAFGTHSKKYFAERGIPLSVIEQSAKHRYVYFLDATWRPRLRVSAFPYPKREVVDENR